MTAKFGKYVLESEIARGAMGIVYRAHQPGLESRAVALKVLQGELIDQPELLERFKREAQALARVQHPNIVRVHDAGEHEGVPYFTMELVEGATLDDLIAERPMEVRRAAALMAQVVRAVAHLHSKGILHRDLKLGNVLLGEDGVPKLSDFGLARLVDRNTRLTEAGERLGTPLYMAPEQFLGSTAADARADVYGLGVMFFRLVTRAYPFHAKSAVELFAKVLNEKPRWADGAPRDPGLRAVIDKAIARKPEARYPTALAFAKDLDALAEGTPVRARPPTAFERARELLDEHLRVFLAVASVLVLVLVIVGGRELRKQGGVHDLDELRTTVASLERATKPLAPKELLAAFARADAALSAAASVSEPEHAQLMERLSILEVDHVAAAVQALRERGEVRSPEEQLRRARPPFDADALATLIAATERARPPSTPSSQEQLALSRAEVLLLAGRPEDALAAAEGAPSVAAALELPCLCDQGPQGAPRASKALALIAENAGVAHVPTDALAVFKAIDLERVAELPESSFASLSLAFSIDKADARALWTAIVREPCAVAIAPGVRATGSLRAVAALARATAAAERLDGATATRCAEDAVQAAGRSPILGASARLLLARARRVDRDLDGARAAEREAKEILLASKDGRARTLEKALAAAEERTRQLAAPSPASDSAPDDERTRDLVSDSACELATAESGAAGIEAIDRARRAAALALERQPRSAAALAALARAEVARAAATGDGVVPALALARAALERERSAVALEAAALGHALRGELSLADDRYEEAARALEASDPRALVRDALLVALRRRAARSLEPEPQRALRHLVAAAERLEKDRVHLTLRAHLHRDAQALAARAQDGSERARQETLERQAAASLREGHETAAKVCNAAVEIRATASPLLVQDVRAMRERNVKLAADTERVLRTGLQPPMLLFWDRELAVIGNGDSFARFGQFALACELDEEIYHQAFVRSRSDIQEVVAGAFRNLADKARQETTDVSPALPHGADPDLLEAVAVSNAMVEVNGRLFDPGRGVAAARRYVRRYPTVRAGRFFLAWLLLVKGHACEAEVEAARALALPALGDTTGARFMKLLVKAEVLRARQDRAGYRRAFRESVDAGLKLNQAMLDERYADAELTEAERRLVIAGH